MGFLFSCCRRPSTDDEREPLLTRRSPTHEELYPPESLIDKVADVFAALHAGKLPSQSQLNTALRKVLRSNILILADSKSGRVLGQQQQYGPLSDRGKNLLKDVRELVEAAIQFGLEKNDDDTIQDLIYQNIQIGKSPVSADLDAAKDTEAGEEFDILANAIPSVKELDNDTRRLSNALFTLSRILVTSSSFRSLLTDVLMISQALLADAAADVGAVAHVVEGKADAVEHTLRSKDTEAESPGDRLNDAAKQVKDGLKDISDGTKEKWESVGTETSDHLKESAVDRFQKVLAQAQQNLAYRSALHTLVYLLGKYVEKIYTAAPAVSAISTSTTTVPTPIITTYRRLERALTDLRMILERLASGRSLSPLVLHLERTLKNITSSPEFQSDLRHFSKDLISGIERTLGEPEFATSQESHDLAQQLFEHGQALMRSNSSWSGEARKMLEEVIFFTDALASDRTTCRVIKALDNLSKDTAYLFQTAAGVAVNRQRELREELRADLIGWVFPRVLNMLETLPMPRVELKSEAVEVVVDAMVLSATASFLPDHVFVQNYNEVRMEASAAASENPYANGAGVQAATRTRIHIDGLRISGHCIGYYVQYKSPLGSWFSWEDNGFMSIDVGRQGATGQGLSVDIELETSPTDEDTDQFSVFRINDVNVDVSGLRVSINKSRHWIFNTLILQPLARPVLKRVLRKVISTQIRTGLENINKRLSAVRSEVHRRVEYESSTERGSSMEDYWKALCATFDSHVDEDSEDQESSLVETDTQVTMRGVVHNTRTKQKPESSSPPTPTETLVAVGLGPQILPGKGGPRQEMDSTTGRAKGALTEVEGVAEHAAGKAKAVADNAIGTAAMTRESLGDAEARMEARKGIEAKKKGWRSRAFDL